MKRQGKQNVSVDETDGVDLSREMPVCNEPIPAGGSLSAEDSEVAVCDLLSPNATDAGTLGVPNAKPEETPYARYRRLRSKRSAKIEQYTRLLANLGNRKAYPWTDEDKQATLDFAARMAGIIRESLADTKSSSKQLGI